MPYSEPYFARYVKSWRKPPKPDIRTEKPKKLLHCSGCTHTCEFMSEKNKSLCPYYNLQ